MEIPFAGWIAAATSVGLLGPVLYWLCYRHLPDKDKQIKELISDKDAQVKGLVKDKDEQIKALIADCDRHNQRIIEHCMAQIQQQRTDFQQVVQFVTEQNEKHVTLMAEALRQELRSFRDAATLPPSKPKPHDAPRSE